MEDIIVHHEVKTLPLLGVKYNLVMADNMDLMLDHIESIHKGVIFSVCLFEKVCMHVYGCGEIQIQAAESLSRYYNLLSLFISQYYISDLQLFIVACPVN